MFYVSSEFYDPDLGTRLINSYQEIKEMTNAVKLVLVI